MDYENSELFYGVILICLCLAFIYSIILLFNGSYDRAVFVLTVAAIGGIALYIRFANEEERYDTGEEGNGPFGPMG